MKKVFALISVFALAMGAMAATQSVTLTITESTTVTDNKVSQNGIVVSGVAKVYKNEHVGCMFINPEVTEFDYDSDGIPDDFAGELEVSLEGGYNITKIVITPQDAWAEYNAATIVDLSWGNWTQDGDNAVWEGNAKSVSFGAYYEDLAVKDIIVYYDDATATAAVEAQADKQKAVKSVNRFGEVTIEANGVKFGINGVKK